MKFIDFKILTSFFKKKEKNEKKMDENERIAQYKFIRLMAYIKSKYPNCPNSDYIRLLERSKNK